MNTVSVVPTSLVFGRQLQVVVPNGLNENPGTQRAGADHALVAVFPLAGSVTATEPDE